MANFLSNAIGAVTGIGRDGGLGTDAPKVPDYANNSYMNAIQNQDQGKNAYSVGGVNYNFAGDPVKASAVDSQKAALDKQIADNAALLKSIAAERAAQPKLPFFDTSANWAKAQAAAGSVVNPVYTDKLNQYLAKKALETKQTTEQTQADKDKLDTALQQALENSQITRTQTNEDTTNKLGDIGANENSYQTQEGRQFDAARTALLGKVANSGLTESGIGQGQVNDAVIDRNNASADQVRAFNQQKRDTNLFHDRTFSDLALSDSRNQQSTTTGKAADDKHLQDYIDSYNLDETKSRSDLESARQSDLLVTTSQNAQLGANAFIQSLIGSGARAQDIALAKQIYG